MRSTGSSRFCGRQYCRPVVDHQACRLDSWAEWANDEKRAICEAGRWRTLRSLDGGGPQFRIPGRPDPVLSFASNDYLGLSQHPGVKKAAAAALERFGAGTGSSRLVVGDRLGHRELEAELAEWRGFEAALVFPTGFQANLAVMTTFGTGARIVSDELNHASIIDGARLAKAEVAVYHHADVDQAEWLVASAAGRALVVSDTVFSMDGDVAPVAELSAMCARHGALLVLDDAHLVWAADPVHPEARCIRVGTLSKTLGSLGGYVCACRPWIELLINRARSFIFTTALAPPNVAAARAALDICRSPEGDALRRRLREHVDLLRPGHPSPIVPIIMGEERAALRASEALLEAGILVPAIRPPTVPSGSSRLRVSLSAMHRREQVLGLLGALEKLQRAD